MYAHVSRLWNLKISPDIRIMVGGVVSRKNPCCGKRTKKLFT